MPEALECRRHWNARETGMLETLKCRRHWHAGDFNAQPADINISSVNIVSQWLFTVSTTKPTK